MLRRTAIQNVLIITAGTALLLAGCRYTAKKELSLKGISLSSDEQDMIAGLTETIIPGTTDFPGAENVECPAFVLRMVNDCMSPEEQKKFTAGLKEFEKLCREKFNTGFTRCSTQQKKSLLAELETNKSIPENVLKFYETVKRYTIQGFTSSEKYMRDIKKYVMVPGPVFKGCVPVRKD